MEWQLSLVYYHTTHNTDDTIVANSGTRTTLPISEYSLRNQIETSE